MARIIMTWVGLNVQPILAVLISCLLWFMIAVRCGSSTIGTVSQVTMRTHVHNVHVHVHACTDMYICMCAYIRRLEQLKVS